MSRKKTGISIMKLSHTCCSIEDLHCQTDMRFRAWWS